MPSEYLMSIDCGSGGVKCFIVDSSGRIVSRSGVEWDRDSWDTEIGWRSLKKAIRKTLNATSIESDQIIGVSTTSMREEFVLLDEHDKEIKFEITSDIYAHGEALNKRLGERIYRCSGHWPVPGWIAAAKLAWLADEHPDVLRKARLFLMISDWAGYQLCGVPYTEGSSACETSLFNVASGDWAWDLIDELKIPSDIFPEVRENSSVVSPLTKKSSRGTLLEEGTPVVVGGADTQCGLIGCGAVAPGDAVAVGGTTTPVQMVTGGPVFDVEGRTWTNMHAISGRWILESNAGRTGWVYRWFRDSILDARHSGTVYDAMNVLAAGSPPGSSGVKVYFGPHVFNAGPPYWKGDNLGDTPVPPTIIGSSRFTRGDLARAILEANCYAVRANLEQIEHIAKTEVSRLGFCGGNSKARIWNEMQAAVLGKPIVVPRERDATAVGAAVCAGVGAGMYRDIEEATRQMVHLEDSIQPNPELHKKYDSLYHGWLETRRKLAGIL